MEYEIHSSRLGLFIILLLLSVSFFIGSNIDPEPETENLDLSIQNGWYYYQETHDVYRTAELTFEADNTIQGLQVLIVPERFFSSNLTYNVGRYDYRSGNLQNFTNQETVSFEAEYSGEWVLFIYATVDYPDTVSLQFTLDSPPYSVTDAYTLVTFFLILIILALVISLQKDFRYLWRFFRAKYFGIELKPKEYESSDDQLDDLFGDRSGNLQSIEGPPGKEEDQSEM